MARLTGDEWGVWRFAQKLNRHIRLLRQDPEAFGRNLSQITQPALFAERLADVMSTPPLHLRYSAAQTGGPVLNVLDTAWTLSGMTGGPNTVINLAARVARLGISVRFVATVHKPALTAQALRAHVASLLGSGPVPDVPIVAASDPALVIGPGDVFLATHWRTAQQLKTAMPNRPFLYMLQEFEPGFYAWSSNFALAMETYGLDFWPIINQSLLAAYLLAQPIGRLNDPVTRERAVVFEPAVDATLFYPAPPNAAKRPRRLLFYARPTNSRNMFGLGLLALRDIAADAAFADWEFWAIGSRDSIPNVPLGAGHVLRRAAWSDYRGYGDLLRSADILLCPMLSPHTSYPVLEMVACGGLSVTNSFATKTAAALSALSSNIIAVAPTREGFVAGLREAAIRVEAGRNSSAVTFPRDWGAVLDPVAGTVADIVRSLAAGGALGSEGGKGSADAHR
jgi:hypothetical protein